MGKSDHAEDLFWFLVALETIRPSTPSHPKMDALTHYAMGHLDHEKRVAIERQAAADLQLGERLFDVRKAVRGFETQRLGAADASPALNPFLAEVYSIWRRQAPKPQVPAPPKIAFDVIGRDGDVENLRSLLAQPSQRLVSITGPGGVGKTCLVRKVVADLSNAFQHGIHLVECGSLRGAEDFYAKTANALGVTEDDNRQAVVNTLAGKEALLLLDRVDDLSNLEAEIVSLLEALPELRILSASRAKVWTAGTEYALSPLGLQEEGGRLSAAVQLCSDIIQRVIGDFKMTAANLRLVKELCRISMGVPLSISIAAGCLSQQDLPDLVENFKRSQSVQTEYANQPVYSTIAHSFLLLSDQDRALLHHLCVFAGGFGFEDAQYICNVNDQVFSDSLAHLQKCGLVEANLLEAGVGYHLHDSVQEYIGQSSPGQQISTQDRHAEVYAGKAARIGSLMREGRWGQGVGELLATNADLRRAMHYAVETEQHERVREFAEGLARMYMEAGFLGDFETLAQGGHKASDGLKDVDLAISLLGLEGALASRRSNEPLCTELWQKRLQLCEEIEDPVNAADCLTDLAWQAFEQGNLAEASSYLDRSIALAQSIGSQGLVATAQIIHARIAIESGNRDQGLAWLATTRETAKDVTEQDHLLFINQNEILAFQSLGEESETKQLVLKHLAMCFEGQRSIHVGWCLRQLAAIYAQAEDIPNAIKCYLAAQGVYREYQTKHRKKVDQDLADFRTKFGAKAEEALRQNENAPWKYLVSELLTA